MHLKRNKVPKNWPLKRKGTAYVVRPNSDTKQGLPLLVIVRDVLELAKNRKEVKRALRAKKILLNKRVCFEDKNVANLFDIITIVPSNQNFRVELSEIGKFIVREVELKDSNSKVSKVIGKKKLKNGRIQINMIDGRNYISDINCKVGDSVVINLEKSNIEKHLPISNNSKVFVFAGKHAGTYGKITGYKEGEKSVEVLTVKENKINVLTKQLLVIN